MISGASCWNRSVQQGMSLVRAGDRDVYTFDAAEPTLYAQLATTAARTPDAVAIVDDWGHRTTFAQLKSYADDLAGYLCANASVRAGDRVGLLMHADAEFAVAFYAISKAGCTCVPIPTKYREPEVASIARAADLKALVMGEEFEPWRQSLPVRPSETVVATNCEKGFGFPQAQGFAPVCEACGGPDDAAIMMFTSGTTSGAKGVVLTNRNVVHATMVYQRLMGTTPTDRCLIPIPIYHVTGLIALLAQFVYVGATTYLHRFFDARRVLASVRDDQITYLHGSPTSFAELVPLRDEFPSLPSVRCMLSGSSYEPVATMRRFHEWMPTATFQVVYGMTETASPALLFPLDSPTSVYAGATGKPVPGVDARIVDEDGADVACGQTGELLLRGACVTGSYFCHDGGEIEPDGWLHTGDLAYANDEGMVWVVDRKKDMINRGGEKVWCSALEEVLCELDGVSEACVAGMPDKLYGEVPVAAIVRAAGSKISAEDIQAALASRIAHFKIPVAFAFVDKIPQTRGDKPNRSAVRDAVLETLGK